MCEDKLNQLDKPLCCYIEPEMKLGCLNNAEWIIVQGCAPLDYTEACTEHVGELLVDEPFNHAYPLEMDLSKPTGTVSQEQ